MSKTTPTVGRQVYVLVHPEHNAGQDFAPATITHVNDDGTLTVRSLQAAYDHPVRVADVSLHDDRAAADAYLDDHRAMLPTPKKDQEPWESHDVYRWKTAAYWPGGTAVDQLDDVDDVDPVADPVG